MPSHAESHVKIAFVINFPITPIGIVPYHRRHPFDVPSRMWKLHEKNAIKIVPSAFNICESLSKRNKKKKGDLYLSFLYVDCWKS